MALTLRVLSIFLLSICVACGSDRPVTYYVDFLGGNDKNSGDSPTAPFKHAPGDKNAKDKAAGVKLKGGDRVIFKGGVAYKGTIPLKWSGEAGKEIVYDGNTENQFGKGRAILDGDNMAYDAAFDLTEKKGFATVNTIIKQLRKKGIPVPSFFDFKKKTGFIKIQGFEITGYGKYGVYLHSANDVVVKDCHIHRISDWNLARCKGKGCHMDYVHNLGTGIYITGDSMNVMVDRCEIERVGHCGIKIQGNIQDVEVKNCDLHDYIHWMIDISPLSSNQVLSNIYIHDNKLRDLYHYASSWWTSYKGGGAHPEDEKVNPGVGENPHLDGIFIRNPTEGVLDNIRVYNNDFYLDKRFNDNGGTAMLFASQIGPYDSLYIYNNTFQYCYMHLVMSLYATGGEIHVYNNTFYMKDKSAVRISGNGKFFVKNNIFYLENGLAINIDDVKTRRQVQSDYNIFRQGGRHLVFDGTWISSLSDWQSISGQDLNSLVAQDMKFMAPQDIENAAKSDLRLDIGSPAIRKGTDLSKFFAIDRKGMERPKGKPWDIGAFQFEEKR
ncbi:MAG: right-handed parallel beta-helix repeat-containing protein [Syntrophorhabdaceae bacterium]|nr:right-handed parallel beta-helix repeat-containing protein [Syntrophorhabdaceae bacterium]